MNKFEESVEKYFNEKIANYSDFWLKLYYRSILHQCIYNNRSDKTLIRYINELEYRGLKYPSKV